MPTLLHRLKHEVLPLALHLGRSLLGVLFTFHLVCLAWLFFRAPSLHSAWSYLQGLFAFRSPATSSEPSIQIPPGDLLACFTLIAILLLLVDLPQVLANHCHEALLRCPLWFLTAVTIVLIGCILLSRSSGQIPFIYFQF